MRRTAMSGDYTVGGDPERRQLPTAGAAISLALNLATRAPEADTFGVLRNGERIATVEREQDGAVQVRGVTR